VRVGERGVDYDDSESRIWTLNGILSRMTRVMVSILSLVFAVSLSGQTKVSFVNESSAFPLVDKDEAAAIVVLPGTPETVRVVANVFADDVQRVTGKRPEVLRAVSSGTRSRVVIVGVEGKSEGLETIAKTMHMPLERVRGKWESAITTQSVDGRRLLVVGSDRRGAAYALFALSKAMGVSPWYWWADVPVMHHDGVYVTAKDSVMTEPSVQYRGIFLNDEDWGLRVWAAKKMDPELKNIGPKTYAHVFELLLRLHANTLWPAMHPGTRAFNADGENAAEADSWGVVMGASHSEVMLRNNVGEWDRAKDGPWNFQTNAEHMTSYWDERLKSNGKYENVYTVGLRGQHDSGLEAKGTPEEKAKLVSHVMDVQRALIAKDITPMVATVPQVIWLYKESLQLYRAGMTVPDDVMLGFADDNFGYLRQLPTEAEARRKGGAGIYYHVSYWGAPHDYLWLSTTPVSLIQEEMAKAWDTGARRIWILNVGDLKPAEKEMEFFLSMAADEKTYAAMEPAVFYKQWFTEQFPGGNADAMVAVQRAANRLNMARKPEGMGFNLDKAPVERTEFNPLAWGDQNKEREEAWEKLADASEAVEAALPAAQRGAYFELQGYMVQAAAAHNRKVLRVDRAALDEQQGRSPDADMAAANESYAKVQALTDKYNGLFGGKWDGMMSAAPRKLHVFDAPVLPAVEKALPKSWGVGPACVGAGHAECGGVVSFGAAEYARHADGSGRHWAEMEDVGLWGDGLRLASEGGEQPSSAAWVEYAMTTRSDGPAELEVDVLPTFARKDGGAMSFRVSVDGGAAKELEATGADAGASSANKEWGASVLRNSRAVMLPLGELKPGKHRVRILSPDEAVVLTHVTLRFAGAAPGYPAPEALVVGRAETGHLR